MTFPGSHAASPPPGSLLGGAIATVTPFYRRIPRRLGGREVSLSYAPMHFSLETASEKTTGGYGGGVRYTSPLPPAYLREGLRYVDSQ